MKHLWGASPPQQRRWFRAPWNPPQALPSLCPAKTQACSAQSLGSLQPHHCLWLPSPGYFTFKSKWLHFRGQMNTLLAWMSGAHAVVALALHQLPECPPASLLAPPGLSMPVSDARDPSPVLMPREEPSGAQHPLGPLLQTLCQPTSQPAPLGSLTAAFEDISLPPTILGSSVGDFEEPEPCWDHFKASALQEFGLALVGLAVSVCPVAEGPATKGASLWTMVCKEG